MTDSDDNSFEQASQSDSGGLISDLFSFMGENKKWWLLPIVAVFTILGAVVIIAASGGGGFIYTLF